MGNNENTQTSCKKYNWMNFGKTAQGVRDISASEVLVMVVTWNGNDTERNISKSYEI